MYAYLGLAMGAQGILAWTFNSHQGGEEQALFGLVDHDNTPSWKVDEFARIAAEFKELSQYGFPRFTHPQVAIAYSFDSNIASSPNGPSNTTLAYFKPAYAQQVQGAFEPLFRANLDAAIINIGHDSLTPYKLVIVPADYVMDPASASAIRAYVEGGGTVLMTAFSAKVDEHGQWFDTPLPGLLSDVFGLKTNAFYTADQSLKFELAVDQHVSPTPRPPGARSRAPAACENISKTVGSVSGAMPMPVSRTRIKTSLPALSIVNRMRPPSSVYLPRARTFRRRRRPRPRRRCRNRR